MTKREISKGDNLHPYCHECRKCRVAQQDGPKDPVTKEPIFRTGEFIIKCSGIPADGNCIPNFDQIKHKLTKEEINYAQTLYDPIAWAKTNLNWEPRRSIDGVEFQKVMTQCSAKRKVFRLGRRLGKTEILCIKILHYLFTNSPEIERWDVAQQKYVKGFSTILVLTPYLAQIKDIFDRLMKFIGGNPVLSNEVKRSVANPFHIIELYNGARIVMFPSGAKTGSGAASIRGQKADLIVLDEMDYLNESDIENVLAMLMEHGDVKLWCSSTPSGKREHFWRFCTERMDFKEFHYTSMVNPSWSPEMEQELRLFYRTELGWKHEILAEFGEHAKGVFQSNFVEDSQVNYKYEEQVPKSKWIYSLGTDWNDTANGTKLCIVGFDMERKKFRVVEKITVQKAGWTQLTAIAELRRLNRKWRPKYIYVDEGYGTVQIELIKKIGIEAQFSGDPNAEADMMLMNIKGIDFGSKVDIFDPFTKEPRSVPMKPYLVNNAVSKFELGMVEISRYDDVLYKQLLGYTVVRVTQLGVPVYEAGPDGDHDLDAFMLGLLAFSLELSEFTNVEHNGIISFAGRFGTKTLESELAMANVEQREPDINAINKTSNPKHPEPRIPHSNDLDTFHGAPGVFSIRSNSRIYSPESFRNDDRMRQQPVKFWNGPPKRRSF